VADPRHDDVVRPLVRARAGFAGEDRDRRPTGCLRASRCSRHHLAPPARDDDAAALGEKATDLLGAHLPLGAAPDHRDLEGHYAVLRRSVAAPSASASRATPVIAAASSASRESRSSDTARASAS
jgi:hypothetical protein